MSRWLNRLTKNDDNGDDISSDKKSGGYKFGDFTKSLVKKGSVAASSLTESSSNNDEDDKKEYKFGDLTKAAIKKGTSIAETATSAMQGYMFGDISKSLVKTGEYALNEAYNYIGGVRSFGTIKPLTINNHS